MAKKRCKEQQISFGEIFRFYFYSEEMSCSTLCLTSLYILPRRGITHSPLEIFLVSEAVFGLLSGQKEP